MILIRQRTRHDCAICTIAMALGRAYEEVMAKALEVEAFDPVKGMRAEYRVFEAFGFEQMVDFRVLHRGVLAPEYFLHFSWGRRAVMAVPSLNIEGGFHSVYWGGHALFDPCDLKTYSGWKELRPEEIILMSEVVAARSPPADRDHILRF